MEEDLFECAACAPNVQSMRAHREWLAAKVNDQGEEIARLKGDLAASELVRGQMTSRALAYEAGLREVAKRPSDCPADCDCNANLARRTLQATEWPPPSATAAPASRKDETTRPDAVKLLVAMSKAQADPERAHVLLQAADILRSLAAPFILNPVPAAPAEEEKCPGCGGRGRITRSETWEERCPTCGGTGRAPSRGEVG